MKKTLILFIFMVALSAFAQEMDTTYVVNQNGETIGIVHKKGEAPVIPSNLVNPTPTVAAQPAMGNLNVNYADSVVFYQRQAEELTISGNKLRSAGKGLMIGGGIGTGIGVVLMLAGLSTESYDEYDDEYEMSGSGTALYLAGYILTCSMPELFITGIILKCIGGSKLGKAGRSAQNANYFRSISDNPLSSLRLSPVINPLNKSVGGNLAFNF